MELQKVLFVSCQKKQLIHFIGSPKNGGYHIISEEYLYYEFSNDPSWLPHKSIRYVKMNSHFYYKIANIKRYHHEYSSIPNENDLFIVENEKCLN